MRHEFSAATKKVVTERAAGRCENNLCRAEIRRGHFDHIIPCGRGGDNSIENCQFLCHDCHKIKTRHDVFEISRNKRILRRKKKKKTPEFRPRRVKWVVRQ